MSTNVVKKVAARGSIDRRVVLAFDVMVSVFSSFIAVALILMFKEGILHFNDFLWLLSLSLIVSLLAFSVAGFYRNVVRNANISSLLGVTNGVVLKLLFFLGILFIIDLGFAPRFIVAFAVLDFLVTLSALGMARVIVARILGGAGRGRRSKARAAMICGTVGVASTLKSIVDSNYADKYRVVGFITSNRARKGNRINNAPVYYIEDNEQAYEAFFEKHNNPTIIFPSAEKVKEFYSTMVDFCVKHSIPMLITPNLESFSSVADAMPRIREVEIEDMLQREPIEIDLQAVRDSLAGKLVMITGAAGSIGSEIVRQIAALDNVRLLLVDNAETPTHNLTLELNEKFPGVDITVELADIRSTSRTRNIIEKYRPNVIYHAAAYKHVPLMECNPAESVMVNVLGTRKMADLAVEFGVEKFVMVSTDKAVNPTNVMGASKRIAEMYVQSLDGAIKSGELQGITRFITTRFGNVLGSNGSVIELFRRQIRQGGPVKVTHPEIIRYFMTIPEACRLVLQASVLGEGGEIFVFDMGEQVRVADLARRMIQLAGLVPERDIKIVYTGLRPGEKLYEEVLSDKETTFRTSHPKIRGAYVRRVVYGDMSLSVEELVALARMDSKENLVARMKSIVPEFISNNSTFEKLDSK